MSLDFNKLAAKAIDLNGIDRDDARAALSVSDVDIYDLLAAARRVRTRFFGNRVRVHVLCNAKLGGCPEDCGFCSQSSHFGSPGGRDDLLEKSDLLERARAAHASGAFKFCIVTATRGPSNRELDVICDAVREIKATLPITVCTSLGLLDETKAARLKAAGVDRFNHNLETSERRFGDVVTTHRYEDRVRTVRIARQAGMEACSGGIVGLGESDEDLLDWAYALKELDVESIPINFLDPRPGTPFEQTSRLRPLDCLKVLAVFRLVHPRVDLRAAGGREANLRSLQPLALQVVNSIFTNGYLTTPGNAASDDLAMIEDAGYVIESPPAS